MFYVPHVNVVGFIEEAIKQLVSCQNKTDFNKVLNDFFHPNSQITVNGEPINLGNLDPIVFGWIDNKHSASVYFTEAIQAEKSFVPNFQDAVQLGISYQILIQENVDLYGLPIIWQVKCTFNAVVIQLDGPSGKLVPKDVMSANIVYHKTKQISIA